MDMLVAAMTDLPHGRRWTINPELNRVYVSAELSMEDQWEAVAEAVDAIRGQMLSYAA